MKSAICRGLRVNVSRSRLIVPLPSRSYPRYCVMWIPERWITTPTMPAITLYTAATPNGFKLSIVLEELGLKYDVVPLSFAKNEQKSESYVKVNPNGRIPGILDKASPFGEYGLMESGAQMVYLTDQYDKSHKLSFPHGSEEYYTMIQWLFFMNAGLGPMQGQANHFFRYAPEKIPYGINRYQTETRRLYSVMEARLTGREWLAGDHISVADIACYSWVRSGLWAGIDGWEEKYPNLKAWKERIDARPAVQRGLEVPSSDRAHLEAAKDPKKAEEIAKQNSAWVMKGMNEEAEKHK